VPADGWKNLCRTANEAHNATAPACRLGSLPPQPYIKGLNFKTVTEKDIENADKKINNKESTPGGGGIE
jgi:hypothetical protein